jgi:aspartate/methionine/tyrosine aminotransferase
MCVPGGKPTMNFAIQMFGEPGTEVLYPNPGFPIYESMIEFSGAKPVSMELREERGFELDPEAVLERVNERTRMIIVNTPANPTGGVIGRAVLDRLVEGLRDWPDVMILADEIYSRMTYGVEHNSLLSYYDELKDRLIVLDGWSKTYSMTGWRLGWGLWPAALIDHAERLQINSNSCPSAPVQVAGIEALNGPQDEVDKMMRAFDERRRVIVEELAAIPGFRCAMPSGAFYAFPNIEGTGMDSRALQNHLLNEAGVATVAGTAFGSLGEGFLRFSYASSLESIREALRRVRETLQPA